MKKQINTEINQPKSDKRTYFYPIEIPLGSLINLIYEYQQLVKQTNTDTIVEVTMLLGMIAVDYPEELLALNVDPCLIFETGCAESVEEAIRELATAGFDSYCLLTTDTNRF